MRTSWRIGECVALAVAVLGAQDVRQAAGLIQPNDLKADIAFLASDDLRGRNAGSAEDHIAADFIASEFMRLGLKPAGDGGTYFQKMEIDTAEMDREHTTLTAKVGGVEHAYRMGPDFRWARQSLRAGSVCGEVAFVGYGINAPEYGYDDFAGTDVKGKVLLVLAREPQADDPHSKFMGTWDTYHAFNWEKLEEARKRGAAGLLLVQDRVPRAVKQTAASTPRPTGQPDFALAGEMWDIPTFAITRDVADELLAPSGKTTDGLQAEIDRTLRPASLEVGASSACLTKGFRNFEAHEGRNVAALLEGSDPNLKAETVLITAHHDHMGVANGHIYNGADDNASGVAGMLAAARAFVHGGVRPKRSVLFVAYDGEERIFLGSYYYVTHPLAPLERTVANLNLDMVGRDENDANWPVPADGNVNMVNVLGTRYNPGLRKTIEDENRAAGLKLDFKMDVVDPDSLWSRSDHFWFATLHIPQVEFQTGLHPDYHTDRDTWDRINYAKLTKIARLVFLTSEALADGNGRPEFVTAGAAAR
ncbi:MAG TPA: M28 family peptidase [Bryobacteraceae bacterium]|nr:M28 family peptidase [Bryobacteraceae bacterium]